MLYRLRNDADSTAEVIWHRMKLRDDLEGSASRDLILPWHLCVEKENQEKLRQISRQLGRDSNWALSAYKAEYCYIFLLGLKQKENSCSRVILEKLVFAQLIGIFPAFYGTRRFITVFTRTRHWSQSRARCIQSTSYNIFKRIRRQQEIFYIIFSLFSKLSLIEYLLLMTWVWKGLEGNAR
jgi:hypothetical protein